MHAFEVYCQMFFSNCTVGTKIAFIRIFPHVLGSDVITKKTFLHSTVRTYMTLVLLFLSRMLSLYRVLSLEPSMEGPSSGVGACLSPSLP